jgi:hypothetical protein
MLVIVPLTLLGQESAAILHAQGGVWVNGYEARDSSAIFKGDLLETKQAFSGTLTLEGTSVLLQPETVGKFDGDTFNLNHGSVAVESSRSFKVRVNCITVTPVQSEFTQYEVTDVNGNVRVAARKLDVNVTHELKGNPTAQGEAASQGGSVHEGEEKSYGETAVCGAQPPPVGPGSGVNPKWIAVGAGGGGLLLCLLLCIAHGGGSSQPVSSSKP